MSEHPSQACSCSLFRRISVWRLLVFIRAWLVQAVCWGCDVLYQRSQHWTGLRPDVGDYPQIGKLWWRRARELLTIRHWWSVLTPDLDSYNLTSGFRGSAESRKSFLDTRQSRKPPMDFDMTRPVDNCNSLSFTTSLSLLYCFPIFPAPGSSRKSHWLSGV